MPTRWLSYFTAHKAINKDTSERFDSLRGISALTVCLTHTYLIFVYPVYPALMTLLYVLGHTAVMIFFSLSGFLICKSASNNIAQHGYFKIKPYLYSRINRVLPPFYFSIIFLLLIYWLAPYFFATGTREFIAISPVMSKAKMVIDGNSIIGSVFFVNGFITQTPVINFSYWSLPFEVWYYTIFGLLLWQYHKIGLCLAFIILIMLSFLNIAFFYYLLVWLSGVFVALAHNRQQQFDKRIVILLTISAITALVIGGSYYYFSQSIIDKDLVLLITYGVFIGLLASTVLYLLAYNKITFRPFFQSLAASSYTLYVLHFPIVLFIYGIVQPYVYLNAFYFIGLTSSCVIICLVCSALIGKWIEKVKLF